MDKPVVVQHAESSKVYIIGGTGSAFTPVPKKAEQAQIITETRHKRRSAFRRIRHLFKCEVSPCMCSGCHS